MKKREIHIVGNWKMNQTLHEISEFFIQMTAMKMELKCKAWIAPQSLHIPILKEIAFTTGAIQVGAQNCSYADSGAFTGEISPAALADIGVEFVIIGHSERRTIFKEDNEILNQKVLAALKHNLKVIYCVGETLEERESNTTFKVIEEQLAVGLKNVPADKAHLLLIAYEPVWAIGTGKVATAEQAEEVHAFIRGKLTQNAEQTIILYGGSVKPDNIDSLLRKENIDGALVGGASLKAKDFKQLCTSASVI
ncbi:triose-phosphate isomerase [Bacteriovorax stolpii]|uniref:Triosephosphate isomerase n=1 Tax=Bacteriovorax stolpii TaxID=960 RepID=A0A2K9NPM8_BACTC|nr:triose-phosphate isomerase [Bacteriovorax stolpii]AUN97025.1 triose-phosphate isomerase [Bacteriovorax stolpii]TDP53311.1 triosephosphate isomerase [Bacteriovorax stolpii]